MELLQQLHRDGQTILLVTHNPQIAAAASRIMRMRDGRLVDSPDSAPLTEASLTEAPTEAAIQD